MLGSEKAHGYRVVRTRIAGGGTNVSTGHLFGTGQLHPLRDYECTLWSEGEGLLLIEDSSLTLEMGSAQDFRALDYRNSCRKKMEAE